ncbi:Flavanone 3-dioxygenase [Handroanthus impetiginosus]|uniref:Flavanone 3-dioxygenase n=1 Tax=Handroanthus impetiginosus TaxID=429701 RepID=A0A2G9I4H0_9LAMI|nr:Flavanone 3-dioxygenase [Handroanthus impetiginosus]
MAAKVISRVQFSSLPSSYIRPESERPKLSEVADCNNVPVVDLGCQDRSLLVKQIGDACQEYGFFQVINHGVSKEAVDKILEVAHEFFDLPVEEKMKLYSNDPSKTMRLLLELTTRSNEVQHKPSN